MQMLHKLFINSCNSQSKHVSFCLYVVLTLVLMQMYDLYSYKVKHKGDEMPLWFYSSLCKSAVLRLHFQYVTPVKSFLFFFSFFNHHQCQALAMLQ